MQELGLYDLFSGILTGIIISYARNFTSNTGLANYISDERFTKFDDINQKRHEYLLELRNKLYAHIDVPHLRGKGFDGIEPYEVEVIIKEDHILFKQCMVGNNEGLVDSIIELCKLQIKRFDESISEKLDLFEAHSGYKIGETLILGKTFPKVNSD